MGFLVIHQDGDNNNLNLLENIEKGNEESVETIPTRFTNVTVRYLVRP